MKRSVKTAEEYLKYLSKFNTSRLFLEEREVSEGKLTFSECWNALKSMTDGESPGNDGWCRLISRTSVSFERLVTLLRKFHNLLIILTINIFQAAKLSVNLKRDLIGASVLLRMSFLPSNFRAGCDFRGTFCRHCSMICSVGEEPVKLSIEIPRQRFWLTFTFLLETISGNIVQIPLIRTKISLFGI